MYENQYVNPSIKKKHSAADLVPRMNLINEDDEVSVLCDRCLAEVNAIDSDE